MNDDNIKNKQTTEIQMINFAEKDKDKIMLWL